jgi:hypothetical protein
MLHGNFKLRTEPESPFGVAPQNLKTGPHLSLRAGDKTCLVESRDPYFSICIIQP